MKAWPTAPARKLAVAPNAFDSRRLIEDYLERLNRGSQIAQREVLGWGRGDHDSLRLSAVPLGEGADPDVYIGEAEISFGLDVKAHRPGPRTGPYSVGIVLAGKMSVTLPGGEFVAGPGQGVIIDTAAVERTQFAGDTHFVEFGMPKAHLARLGAELLTGSARDAAPDVAPRFAPLLQPGLAQRLLFMATQAADVLQRGGPAPAVQAMFQRWAEMMALTVLHEQPRAAMRSLVASGLPAPRGHAAATPARLRRALDFIDAHAHRNIELADVAQAAHLSASTLLRQFKEQLGLSPGAFLRQVRLDRARAELRSGQGTVREVAQRWGFLNASKFSQAYQQRFGELPTQTQRGR